MKHILIVVILFQTIQSLGQNLETDDLWRTKGVYDSTGQFVELAKIQSFLYISNANQIQRLRTQDNMNMETGETKVFVYQDTLDLMTLKAGGFKINDDEFLTIHSPDSITIEYNGYNTSYVRLSLPEKKVKVDELQKILFKGTMIQTFGKKTEYYLTYQDNGLVKISPVDSQSEWESDYKLIDFNGYVIIQGIVSAPKLVVKIRKDEIELIEIDYRFENKKGILKKIR